MLKIKRSRDLIFNMGIPILVRWHLYIESGPRYMHSKIKESQIMLNNLLYSGDSPVFLLQNRKVTASFHPLHAELIWGNIKIHFCFPSILDTEKSQFGEICGLIWCKNVVIPNQNSHYKDKTISQISHYYTRNDCPGTSQITLKDMVIANW